MASGDKTQVMKFDEVDLNTFETNPSNGKYRIKPEYTTDLHWRVGVLESMHGYVHIGTFDPSTNQTGDWLYNLGLSHTLLIRGVRGDGTRNGSYEFHYRSTSIADRNVWASFKNWNGNFGIAIDSVYKHSFNLVEPAGTCRISLEDYREETGYVSWACTLRILDRNTSQCSVFKILAMTNGWGDNSDIEIYSKKLL